VQVVRLVDEADMNSLIENKTYTNALIVGPAVMVLIENVALRDNTFAGDNEALFIELPEGRRVIGVIGLRNVTFERCEFRNVSIAGTPDNIAEFKKGFGVT
jgi:hypothetical protein